MFDAESWVLTHYLTIGNAARSAQLGNYLNALAGGADADAAFGTAFGDISVLQQEVQGYARNLTFLAALFTFDEKVTRETPPRGEKLSDAEAQAYLGEL